MNNSSECNTEAVRPRAGNRLWRFFKLMYIRIIREKGSPSYIAGGWALGVFVGCVVPVFLQLIVAVPLSFILRCSKIGAAGGTFVTTPPTAVVIYPIQCFIGSWLLGNPITLAEMRTATSQLVQNADWASFTAMGSRVIAAFFAGGLLWAALLTPLTYFGVRNMVLAYRKFRAQRMADGK